MVHNTKILALSIIISLTTACQQSAFTQAASKPTSTDWEHPETPWHDPDLQGMWPVTHLISVPLERPEKYGNRLFFTEEEMAEEINRTNARNERYELEDSQDRIGQGHWAEETELPTQTSLIVSPPNGRLPEQTTLGETISATMGSSWNRTVFDSVADFETWDRCITRGMPTSMFPGQYNNGLQIIQTPGYVVINQEMIHEVRIIPVNSMPTLDNGVKQWLGSSRGHWEGNTLVVETTNFNGLISMTNFVTPGSPIDPRATSTELKITERFERTSDDSLTYTVTVDDPKTQTQPWTAQLPWKLDNEYQFFEYACNEDNHAIRDFINTSRYSRAQEAEQKN